VNAKRLLCVLVVMSSIHSAAPRATGGELPRNADADAAVRQLY